MPLKSTLFNRLTPAGGVRAAEGICCSQRSRSHAPAPSSCLPGHTLSLRHGWLSSLGAAHHIVPAFRRATLEEVTEADLIGHSATCTIPDTEAQRRDVQACLRELGPGRARSRMVFSRCAHTDRIGSSPAVARGASSVKPCATIARMPISADHRKGCDQLLSGSSMTRDGKPSSHRPRLGPLTELCCHRRALSECRRHHLPPTTMSAHHLSLGPPDDADLGRGRFPHPHIHPLTMLWALDRTGYLTDPRGGERRAPASASKI